MLGCACLPRPRKLEPAPAPAAARPASPPRQSGTAARYFYSGLRASTDGVFRGLVAPAVGWLDQASCTAVRISEHCGAIEVCAPQADDARVVIYFHGGAHVVGSVWTHREFMGRVSTVTRARVVGVDYRKAPQNPFPAALDDALAAWRWTCATYPTASVAVMGDSAGGNLAFALLVKLAQLQEAMPVACVGFSPWLMLDPATVSERRSQQEPAEARTLSTRSRGASLAVWDWGATRCARKYLEGHDGTDPLVSPLVAPLDLIRRFPPVLLHAAEKEPLADDAREMQAKCLEAGLAEADAQLVLFPGSVHVFQALPTEKSRDSFAGVATFLEGRWRRSATP